MVYHFFNPISDLERRIQNSGPSSGMEDAEGPWKMRGESDKWNRRSKELKGEYFETPL